ncbi:DUF1127 domain-containing protein [Roseobacteraceae bacterium NS-SX3]
MATIARQTAPGPFYYLRKVLAGIGSFFMHAAEANARARAIQQLSALSDAELAQRGIKREEIVRHVFSDSLYV